MNKEFGSVGLNVCVLSSLSELEFSQPETLDAVIAEVGWRDYDTVSVGRNESIRFSSVALQIQLRFSSFD